MTERSTPVVEGDTGDAEAGAATPSGALAALRRLAGNGRPPEEGPDGKQRLEAFVVEHWRGIAAGLMTLVAIGLLATTDVNLGGVLVDGISIGSVYAVVALGIALVYRSTRVLNFAQGELGTVPAFLVLMFLTGFNLDETVDPATLSLPFLVSMALVGVLFGAILAVGINALVIQRLSDATPVTSLVATVVVSLLFIGGQVVIFGLQVRRFPRMLEGALCFVQGEERCLLQTNRHNLVILGVLIVAAALLALLFRTELGTALLAVAQDPYAASLHGVSPRAMSSLAWGIGGALAAIGGILGAGFFDLSPGLMTRTFLIPAFTAAVLGGITSMTGAVVGGLLLGLVAALANGVTSTYGLTNVIPSPPTLASFTVLLLVLLVRPRGLFGKDA